MSNADPHETPIAQSGSLNTIAWQATLHCLTGCAIGEILGMVLGTYWGWGDGATIVLAVTLAFLSGYAMTIWPLVKSGIPVKHALLLALQADTASVAIMEIVDNGTMLVIPGAMSASIDSLLFWGAMTVSLLLAAIAAFPVNRWLIKRGKGHLLLHAHH